MEKIISIPAGTTHIAFSSDDDSIGIGEITILPINIVKSLKEDEDGTSISIKASEYLPKGIYPTLSYTFIQAPSLLEYNFRDEKFN